MEPSIHILHLEDDSADAELVQARLGEAGLSARIACVQERDEFESALQKGGTDIILADYRLPKYDGMSALRLTLEQCPEIPFVFVSGTMGEEAAIEALTQGATDYVLKENLSRLPSAVQRALEETRNRQERQQAQKALQQSNDLLRAIIEAAPVAIIGLDPDGHVHSVWNPAAEKMLDWSAQDVMDRPLPTMPFDRQEEFKRFREQIQSGMSLEGEEVCLQRRDGTPIDCCIYASSLHDAQGRISGSIAVLVDITEQKQTEETLRASEERLQLALDAAQMGQWDWNIATGEVGWSRQCLALYGLPPDTPMSYERFLQALHPEDRKRIDASLRRAVEDRTSYDELKRTVWPDGSVHWTASRGQVYCDDTRQPIRMTGVSFDISKWKEAEETLQKSHEELRAFFSQTIDACFFMMLDEPVCWDETTDKEAVLDYVFAHQRIIQINEAMLAQYGATREQMLNLTPTDFFQHNLAHGRDLWRQLFDTGKISLESDERKLDGTPMWIEGEYILLYDSEGRITGHFGIQRDVTERKQMEEERQIHIWFLESMDKVNQAMQGTDEPEQMMRDVLDAVLSIFDCDRAFLMYPCDPESQTWTSPMERTKPEYPGVGDLNIVIPMDPQVAETLRILLAADGPVTFGPGTPHALPENVSKQFNIKSFMSTAIYPKTGSPWQFGIHQCSYARIWTAEEERLFQEIGRRLADALTSMLAYRHLQENEERYRLIAENTADTISVFDLDLKPIYTSPSVLKLRGYTVQEAMTQSLDQVLTPESLQKAKKVFAEQLALEASGKADPARTVLLELEEYCKDGSTIWVELAVSALRDNNLQPTGLLTVSRDITERKRTEEVLTLFRSLIDNANDIIEVADPETGRFLDVNERACLAHGYTREEYLSLTVPQINPVVAARPWKETMEELRRSGPLIRESQHRRKDGSIFPVEITVNYVRMDRDYILSVVRDITQRKLADEALRASEERYRALYHENPSMFFTLDTEGTIISVNDFGASQLGYTADELEGQSVLKVICEEDKAAVSEQLRSCLQDRSQVYHWQLRKVRKDGSLMWVEEHARAVNRPDGVIYFLVVCQDITNRKHAEESIRKLSEAIEQSPVSIVITDLEGRIEFVNTRFTQITGYSYDEVLGQNPRILKSGETPAEEYRRLWKTISSGGVWRGEFHNRKKSGDLYWESASISPIFDAGDTITHYVAVKEDITARKRLEAQFRQAQKMESVGRLAGGVAHDFNNMLGVIIGTTELILDRVDPTLPLYSDLQEIRKAAERSADLTRQLLAFARRQTVAPKVLDLNKTVEGTLRMLRRLIGEDIELAWLPGARVWPVKVDPSQIDQIMANLCVNARDAIAGVGKVVIETGTVTFDESYCDDHPGFVPGEYVLLAVSDDGHGMHKETLDKIFEPFFTTKEMGKGTGLGLATVYGIVKQNDGFINVYSEPEHGTTFKIYLPRHAAMADQMGSEDPDVLDIRGDETILLVEDDPATLEVGKRMLERYGYRALAASTPGEAIRLAGEHAGEIRLLISDVIMPEMNGRDLAKNLDSLCPGLRHLFISGYTGNVIAQHGVLDEGENFIQKPFSMQNLAAKVREVLDSKLGGEDLVRKPFREKEIFNARPKDAEVGYILDESIEHRAKDREPSSEDILTPGALAKLPDDLLADLKQAVIDLDLDRINAVIERIRELNAPAAQALTELADDFQYDKLLALITI